MPAVSTASTPSAASAPRVALFVTCLVDLFRPSVGFAAVTLLERAGCHVEVPPLQVCCGQPGYNSGDRADAQAIAKQVITAFAGYDYVVAPSGSCAGMIAKHYAELFAGDAQWEPKARELAARTYELVSFLVDVRKVTGLAATFSKSCTYHDSCSSFREMGVKTQPRTLLAEVDGLSLKEVANPEICCGFGGAFSLKYPDISGEMVGRKSAAFVATGAQALLGGDMGCLLNLAGKFLRDGQPMEVRHIAEVLAGATASPAIGEDRS